MARRLCLLHAQLISDVKTVQLLRLSHHQLHLQVPTTIGYHQLILDTEDFKAGNVDTGFIPSHAEELAEPPTTGKLVRAEISGYGFSPRLTKQC